MIRIIFTLDYEIHGNGEGNPYKLMVVPTENLLRLFEEYGAKLTVMADTVEIMKFKNYKNNNVSDKYCYDKIENQLRSVIRRGHDVQLHIHSSFYNAIHNNQKWVQDYSEYNFAELKYDRMENLIRIGKEYLENLLKAEKSEYRCIAFRAANWAVSPSKNVVRALIKQGIRIDTSVFKYGSRNGIVSFDYSSAFSHVLPWQVDEDNICKKDPNGRLWEFPIYCENRWIGAFVSPVRFYRSVQSRLHRLESNLNLPEEINNKKVSYGNWLKNIRNIFNKHPWKADFNQCTGRQLIKALKRAESSCLDETFQLPFIMIGHSKLCTKWNLKSLRSLLKYISKNNNKYKCGIFEDFFPMINNSTSIKN